MATAIKEATMLLKNCEFLRQHERLRGTGSKGARKRPKAAESQASKWLQLAEKAADSMRHLPAEQTSDQKST
jgi:hypothetical protein